MIELFLGFKHTFQLLVSLFFFSLVLALEDLVLLLSVNTIALHNVVIIVSALKSCLHAGKLVLHAIELDTCLFTGLSNFAHFLFLFAKLKVYALVFVCQLLSQGILEPRHQRLKGETVRNGK